MRKSWRFSTVLFALACVATTAVSGESRLAIKPLAQKTVQRLPDGPLYWQIENFATLSEAKAAAGATGLAVESAGKVWLFRLGPAGMKSVEGGKHVAQVGPVPRVTASEYLLRINEATGAPGSMTKVHSHPGSEAFYVLTGEQSIRSPGGVMRIEPGQSEPGQGAGVPMQVSSTGTGDLHALVMFVVDATKPFSSPATFP